MSPPKFTAKVSTPAPEGSGVKLNSKNATTVTIPNSRIIVQPLICPPCDPMCTGVARLTPRPG